MGHGQAERQGETGNLDRAGRFFKGLHIIRVVRHWKRWLGLLWCLSKIFKVQLDMTLSNLM